VGWACENDQLWFKRGFGSCRSLRWRYRLGVQDAALSLHRNTPQTKNLFRKSVALCTPSSTSVHDWKEEKITFDAAYGNERVITYLFLPSNAKPPYQTVLIFPAAGALYTQSSADLDGYFDSIEFMIKSARAVMFTVYKGTFERGANQDSSPWPNTTSVYRDRMIMWSKDLGRSIDYLETRPDIDHEKLAYEGYSLGAALGSLLPGVEHRFKAVVLICGGFWLQKRLPEADQINFAPRIKAPGLMLSGRFDYVFPVASSQDPMFEWFGTPKEHKRRVLYDTGHDLPDNEVVKETLNWLDRYLGPIKRQLPYGQL
jgi:hypothetical protein